MRMVIGSLDNVDILEEESPKADIILHFADSDHLKQSCAEPISAPASHQSS